MCIRDRLWRGQPLVDLEEWEPGNQCAERLGELRHEAQELWLEAALQAGHHREVLAEARAMVRAMPLRERRWRLLALAQYQSGRQGEALATLHELRRVLVSELGLDPGPEVADLEQAILRQEPALLVEAAQADPEARCPYRGLAPYDMSDSEGYFGRDNDVGACLDRLRTEGVLAVVGPSGSGKSSLVRAGIAAALTRDGAAVVTIIPGEHPLDTLSAVPEPSHHSFLVVDQCEEVFSLCQDPAEQREFLDRVVDHAYAAPVVVALRADRMGEVSGHPGFAKLVERGLYVLPAMGVEDLAAAIEGPARQHGLVVEPGLVDVLVREVESEPGALPLLSHALRETWLRREGRNLTVAGYRASGGIRGAVAQSAEDVYERVGGEADRRALRDLLLRLVTPGPGGEPVRSRMLRRLVASDPEHDHLVDLLVAARLVTSDDGIVELAHEALARAWPRLEAWLQDDVDGQRLLHHLTDAANAWHALGRPDSELYRGTRLAHALSWREKAGPVLTPDETAFLDRAETVERAEERAALDQARAQGRMIRRLRLALAGAAVFLALALISGGLAVAQKRAAQENAATAIREATSRAARQAGTRALVSEDIEESMLLAVGAVRMDDSAATRSSLFGALARHPELVKSTHMKGRPVISFDVHPDGRTVATYDEANHVRLYEIGTGLLRGEFQAGSRAQPWWQSGQVSFSPDGSTLAVVMTAPARHPVTLLDADSLTPLRPQPRMPENIRWQVNHLAWSGDGLHLAAAIWRIQGHGPTRRATRTSALVWDLRTRGRPPRSIPLQASAPYVALSPDGRLLYASDLSNPVTIHDLVTGRSLANHRSAPLGPVTLSPDGRLLVGTDRGGMVLLDAKDGTVRRRLLGTGHPGKFANFSPDGSKVTTVANHEAVVWSVATGALLNRLPLVESGEVADFGPDGTMLYTAGSGSSLRHWALTDYRRYINHIADAPPDIGDDNLVQPSPGGLFIAYSKVSDEGSQDVEPTASHVNFVTVSTGTAGPDLDRGTGYRALRSQGTWHPDGRQYALATGAEIRVWDAATDTLIHTRRLSSGSRIRAIDYTTDGSRLVVSELPGRVRMLDSTTLTEVGRPVTLDESVCCLAAGPDNRTAVVLTGYVDPAGFLTDTSTGWAMLDLRSGRVLDRGELGFDGTGVDFSPDGRHAAVGGSRGEVLALDTRRGEPVRSPVVGHQTRVGSPTYSSDGSYLLTSGTDGTVGLWDGETGQLLSSVQVASRPAAATFGSDLQEVVVAPLRGGPIYKWDTDLDTAIAFACGVAGRDLTKAEWRDQFGDRPYRRTCAREIGAMY